MKVKFFLVAMTAFIVGCTSYPIRKPLESQITEQQTICHIALPKFGEPNDREDCKEDSVYTVGWKQRVNTDKDKAPKIAKQAKIFILEINDQGLIVNKNTANEALAYVRAGMQKEHKPLVNLFVHGWNNNAAPDNHDLMKFERVVVGLNDSQPIRDTEVIGIYVSWRGKTLPAGLSHAFTFWSRKAVSEEVGRGELTNFIFDMEAILKPHLRESDSNGKFILAGHSFGASALYNAVGHTLIARFYDSLHMQMQSPESNQPIRGVGDIVILLNPAIQALRFRSLREAVYSKASESEDGAEIFKHNKAPIFVVLASEADFPVEKAFPIGRSLGKFMAFDGGETMPIHTGIHGNVDQNASISEAERHSIGFYEQYYTHFILGNTEQQPKGSLFQALMETPKGLLNRPKEVIEDPSSILQTPKVLFETPKALLHNLQIKDQDEPLNIAACFSETVQDKLKLKEESEIDWFNRVYQEEKLKDTHRFYTEVTMPASQQTTDLFNFKIFNHPAVLDETVVESWPLIETHQQKVIQHVQDLTWQRNPYWFMKANANFMQGHNGIWNNNVMCLLIALMTTETVSNELFEQHKASVISPKPKVKRTTQLEETQPETEQ